jgi:hypothetical protein
MRASRVFAAVLATALLLAMAGGTASQPSYEDAIQKWRDDLDASLKSEDGWLTVVGLFWLKAGPNRVGSDPSNDIVLPKRAAPARVGVFLFESGQTTLTVEAGIAVLVNGKPAGSARLRPEADRVSVGDLTMFVIKRADRYGIRLRDKNSEARRTFTHRVWYPVKASFKVTGRFVPYNPPRQIAIVNVIGDVAPMPNPGYVEFTLNGQVFRLDPVAEPGASELFFILKDQTAGMDTYPAGRFLYTALPQNGSVELDFNRAINPPCAFTAFATCPLPPRQNQLPVRIEAGERYVAHK